MTSQSPFRGRVARAFPTLPKGETVASFETYQEAQAAVDRLAKAEFPVRELSIVGTDLTSVERITGKLTWGRGAGAGALSGAWFGTFLGLLFFIFSPTGAGLGILGAAVLIGAGFGMIFGLVSYSLNRRRRDFTSVMQVLATRYAIIAEPEHLARAREVLGVGAPVAAAPAAPTHEGEPRTYGEAQDAARRGTDASAEPPRYGERLPAPGDEPSER
ncbi:general stress protein [Agromyces silvae]|uniref:general stress protein n=1 Tax=Agromyces silvae TaxID=3388266 RepID=UPI00280A989B|nr:general stress protein [Agromyces protaetiae]